MTQTRLAPLDGFKHPSRVADAEGMRSDRRLLQHGTSDGPDAAVHAWQGGGDELVLHPRHAWIVQVVGTLLLLALGLAFHFVPGFAFESGLLLLLALAMVIGLFVLAIRPPAARIRQLDLVIRRSWGSVVIDRDHFLGYTFQRASRVVGGESASSNRSLVISYRSDDGSVHVIPALWSYRWLGSLSVKEQATAAKVLDDWRSEMPTSPVS